MVAPRLPQSWRVAGSQIAFAQNLRMMADVSRRDVRERSHRERIVTGNAALVPRGRWQGFEEALRRGTDRLELLHVTATRSLVRFGGGDRDVLVEAWRSEERRVGKGC